jgi:hypothetical protein
MLSVYLVLLCFIPSTLAVGPLGSLGRPANLWGLVLAFWWGLYRLQASSRTPRAPHAPVRLMFGVLFVVALVSFAAAMLRGQPSDQIKPAISSVLRLVSLAGVLFVAIDGIRVRKDLRRVVDMLVYCATGLALLGMAQFLTGQQLVDRLPIPGLTAIDSGGAQVRGSFIRAAGTATNPLEYAVVLGVAFPVALAFALRAPRPGTTGAGRAMRCFPLAAITLAFLLSGSRSALLGLAVAVLCMLPRLRPQLRRWVIVGGVVLVVALAAAAPSMFRTMLEQFMGVSDDPSAQSRTNALAKAPGFIAASPFVGTGYGTFLSRYYIFDNAWVLMTVELGIIGVAAFAGLCASAAWSGLHLRKVAVDNEIRVLGHALATSVITASVMFFGFDGMSFAISGGMLFCCLGLCAAARTVAASERAPAP